MRAVDGHIHWFPTAYYEFLEQRTTLPRATRDGDWWNYINGPRSIHVWPEWFDLDGQFETVAKTGEDMALLCSMGVHSDMDGLPAAEAREGARIVNEEWAAAQRRYPERFFAAAAVPLQDTQMAIDELEYAIGTLGLRGVSLPGTIAGEPLDAPRLEAFYAKVAELGVPMFIHPTDGGPLTEAMAGYGNGIYSSLGRVVDSSVAVLRLVLSGLLDRYPELKIVHFHAGGVLPFASGRLDKNIHVDTIEDKPSSYLKRMWVDTAMPHALTIEMAIKYYGADRVFFGSDNPCWNPTAALEATRELDLSADQKEAIFSGNVRALVDLSTPAVPAGSSS